MGRLSRRLICAKFRSLDERGWFLFQVHAPGFDSVTRMDALDFFGSDRWAHNKGKGFYIRGRSTPLCAHRRETDDSGTSASIDFSTYPSTIKQRKKKAKKHPCLSQNQNSPDLEYTRDNQVKRSNCSVLDTDLFDTGDSLAT